MTGGQDDGEESCRASVVVTAPAGLHARPAIRLSRLAKRFGSKIEVRVDGQGDWVDVKSVLRLIALKAESGARLDFAARGGDAEAALAEVSALVARDFDEGAKPHG